MLVASSYKEARKYFDEHEDYLSYGAKLSDFAYNEAAKTLAFSLIDVEKECGVRIEFEGVSDVKLNMQIRGRAFEPMREGAEYDLNLKDGFFALEDEWSGLIELKSEKISVNELGREALEDFFSFNEIRD